MNDMAARLPGGPALAAISKACLTAGILLLALMSLLIVVQVVGRNLFDLGMPWADELSRFCGVALVFLGVPLLALRGAHVAVDMVPTMLPPQGRRICILIAELMMLAFAAISVWAIYAFLSRAWKFATPTLGIPFAILLGATLFGFAAAAVVHLVHLRRPPQADTNVSI